MYRYKARGTVEVKAGEVTKQDISSLRIFKDYFPQVERCFIVSMKEKNRMLDGITICGVSELFQELGL